MISKFRSGFLLIFEFPQFSINAYLVGCRQNRRLYYIPGSVNNDLYYTALSATLLAYLALRCIKKNVYSGCIMRKLIEVFSWQPFSKVAYPKRYRIT